jgi:hypothetical protein
VGRKARATCRTLKQIPGETVTAAADRLPACTANSMPQVVEVDTQLWGRYKVTFEPMRHTGPRGLAPRWLWIPVAAERLA